MKNNNGLRKLVLKIQESTTSNSLTSTFIESSITELGDIGYSKYNSVKFPKLKDMSSFNEDTSDTPSNPAEALLWKLGKWPSYCTFVENFNNKELVVSKKGGVVFSAFAKHLQDPTYPIYDQHAIRALWAMGVLNESETVKCTALLLKRSKNWKSAGSGDDGACYKLFEQHITALCQSNSIGNAELDKLLMPLGQALKKATTKDTGDTSTNSDLSRFNSLCFSVPGPV